MEEEPSERAPRIVRRELCSPRGTTIRYVLNGISSTPNGSQKVVEVAYKQQSVTALKEHEAIDRKKMTAICAKNNLSYKRAMAHFIVGKRAEQLQAAREQQRKRRSARKARARAELALVAAAIAS